MDIVPKTSLGKWSVGLNAFFLIVIAISILLVKVFGILSFDDHWWDVTVLVFLAPIIALFTSVKAIRKKNEPSVLVHLSIYFSILVILFLLLHSLFISN